MVKPTILSKKRNKINQMVEEYRAELEKVKFVECDYCGCMQPESRIQYTNMPRNGHHDGRHGMYAFCRFITGSIKQKQCPHEFRNTH